MTPPLQVAARAVTLAACSTLLLNTVLRAQFTQVKRSGLVDSVRVFSLEDTVRPDPSFPIRDTMASDAAGAGSVQITGS